MNSEDTQRDTSRLGPESAILSPSATFERAIALYQQATDALGAAIYKGCAQTAQVAASKALDHWLSARDTVQQLESTTPVDVAITTVMRCVLRTHRRVLMTLLRRAVQQLPSPELHHAFRHLWSNLTQVGDDDPSLEREIAGRP